MQRSFRWRSLFLLLLPLLAVVKLPAATAEDASVPSDDVDDGNSTISETGTTSTGTTSPTEEATLLPVCPEKAKRLYVFVGPHRSAASSVEEFFMKYARGRQPGGAHGKTYHALSKVRWPLVYGEHSNNTYPDKPYKRYNHLIDSPGDEPLRKEILDAIYRDYYGPADISKIFFGGEEFDQVKPFSQYDSVDAVRDVVEYLKIPSLDCVTIVINYRMPRFDHWMSIYNQLNVKEIQSDDETMYDTVKTYEQHMCSETEKDMGMRFRELGTTMNPMYLSSKFVTEGYTVQMIDMSGIGVDPDSKGKDISHSIGCVLLDGICDGKWVKGHENEQIRNNAINATTSVEQELIDDAEKLFRYRDCAYKRYLQNNDKFHLIYATDVFEGCNPNNKELDRIYKSLQRGVVLNEVESTNGKKTEFAFDDSNDVGSIQDGNQLLFEALLSQLKCRGRHRPNHNKHEVPVMIKDVLSGKYITDVVESGVTMEPMKFSSKTTAMVNSIEDAVEDVIEDVSHPSKSNAWVLIILSIVVICCGGFSIRHVLNKIEWRPRHRTGGGISGGRSAGIYGNVQPRTFEMTSNNQRPQLGYSGYGEQNNYNAQSNNSGGYGGHNNNYNGHSGNNYNGGGGGNGGNSKYSNGHHNKPSFQDEMSSDDSGSEYSTDDDDNSEYNDAEVIDFSDNNKNKRNGGGDII